MFIVIILLCFSCAARIFLFANGIVVSNLSLVFPDEFWFYCQPNVSGEMSLKLFNDLWWSPC